MKEVTRGQWPPILGMKKNWGGEYTKGAMIKFLSKYLQNTIFITYVSQLYTPLVIRGKPEGFLDVWIELTIF